ncbi:5,10-methylenetetrahydrofolate reductase [hydrothermal vent metagenome]|uniref:5,10-methylenetetrahydrofolate reductase n=1 Tax=hydrothermal vent metagenome TaxID=652676 RepID=A0A3B0U574_9ZZZZ
MNALREDSNPNDIDPTIPLPKLAGHVSHTRFERVLRAGQFAVTSEIAPPDSADPNQVLVRADLFNGVVDAINATDGSGANCHMSSMGICAILTRNGYSPIIQVSCRDRNRIAIQGDVLGAAAMGVGSVLCLSGDHVSVGDQPGAKPVFDLDSISLIKTIRTMRDEGRFLSGRKLDKPPSQFIGSTINPFAPPYQNRVDQLAKKVRAGANFIQTQYCFDIEMLTSFMARAVDMGLAEKTFILVGTGPLASAGSARWLRANIPGVHIPDAVIDRLAGADKPREEGHKICAELMARIKEIDGVRGIHVMAYKQEKFVKKIIRNSGVLGSRKPWERIISDFDRTKSQQVENDHG